VYRLVYNGDVAAGQLAVFQGASEAQILRDLSAMQAQAAEFTGCAGRFRCFWREEFETVCFDLFILIGKSRCQKLQEFTMQISVAGTATGFQSSASRAEIFIA
jgi:hypothetical protein